MSSHPGVASAQLTSAGAGVCEIRHNKSGIVWRIYQMSIKSTPDGLLTLQTTFNGLPLMTPCTVYSGTAADGPPPIDIGDHDVVAVTISNGPALSNVTLTYYYEELVEGTPLGGTR